MLTQELGSNDIVKIGTEDVVGKTNQEIIREDPEIQLSVDSVTNFAEVTSKEGVSYRLVIVWMTWEGRGGRPRPYFPN